MKPRHTTAQPFADLLWHRTRRSLLECARALALCFGHFKTATYTCRKSGGEPPHSKSWRQVLGGCTLSIGLCLFALLQSGCSTKPASASFASVVITNRTPAEIATTAGQVFRENGFAGTSTSPTTMLFEREGSQANNVAYNGIVSSYYGSKVLVRVKTELVDLGGDAQRLQCQAYMVRNASDAFFEEESRLSNMRGGTYQKILNEVAKRLNPKT
jgi:hypothetical protein